MPTVIYMTLENCSNNLILKKNLRKVFLFYLNKN